MKLLLLDYISYTGHQNFNKIHIDALLSLGHDLYLYGKRGQFDNIDKSKVEIYEIPDCFFKDYPITPVSFRLRCIAALNWLKKHIIWEQYDIVIILTYDILSLFTFKIKQKTILINHNNVPQLWSKIKQSLTRRLPPNYIHVALNKEMEARLKEIFPFKVVYHVPHGVCPPSDVVKKPSFISEGEKFLFCPVNSNYDKQFVINVFEDRALSDFLKAAGITLYVKASLGICGDENVIKKVPATMDYGEYNYMLQNAVSVLLPYGENFKYRCSGIFFECVARNTPIITTQLNAMAIYKNSVNMRMFNDVDGLIKAVDYFMQNEPVHFDSLEFSPKVYWGKLFEKMK